MTFNPESRCPPGPGHRRQSCRRRVCGGASGDARGRDCRQRDALTESCGIPAESLAVILPKLVDAGIIQRQAGPPERVALTRAPGEIKLLQIVEAIEGEREPELLLPRDVGSTETHATGDTVSSADQCVGMGAPALKTVLSSAASLLATHTVADLFGPNGGSAPRTQA